MRLPLASAPLLILALQRDLAFRRSIVADCKQLLLGLYGQRATLRLARETKMLVDLAYYLITTLQGRPTLGEEYAGLVQCDLSTFDAPSFPQRLVLILTHVLSPYLLDRLFAMATENNNSLLARVAPTARAVIPYVHRAHLALFYLRGAFLHLSHRTANVRYISRQHGTLSDPISAGYRLLGVLAALEVIVRFAIAARRWWSQRQRLLQRPLTTSAVDLEPDSPIPGEACSLCLGTRTASTATPCGHLFCWNCIIVWTQEKPLCPMCRQPAAPQQCCRLFNI